MDIKELSKEKENLKKQNVELRRRSPSPTSRPRSNYAASSYAPSLVGSPNGGFYDDDQRSMIEMPRFDAQQNKR